MSKQTPRRVLRYSRPPSLSTIGSTEEQDLHSSTHPRGPALSPYSGGASNRTSLVSPLEQHEYGVVSPNAVSYEEPPSYRSINEKTPPVVHTSIECTARKMPSETAAATRPAAATGQVQTPTGNVVILDDEDLAVKDQYVKGIYLQTEWMHMLLQLDQIKMGYNFAAGFCTWIILAAYLILPATFTTLQRSEATRSPDGKSNSQIDNITHAITTGVDHLGVAVFSALLASTGGLGCLMMWFRHRRNYLWISTRIFAPVMLNSFAGLITTLVSVYTAQNKVWSLTATINAAVAGGVAGLSSFIYGIYFFLLRRIRKEHNKQFPDPEDIVNPMAKLRTRKYMAEIRRKFAKSAA